MSTKKLDPRIERLLRLVLEARRAGALEQAGEFAVHVLARCEA